MKKESVVGLIVWIVLLAASILIGFFFLREYFPESEMEQWEYMLFLFGAIVVGLLFNSILFELAHMIGAKVGSYKILSVNILGLCFSKKNGKAHVGFAKFDGLTGETKILPKYKKDAKKKPNPVPFCVTGTTLYAIEIIAVVFAFYILRESKVVALKNTGYFFLVAAIVGALILAYNIVPFHLDTMTDGYRLRLVSNKQNKNAFNEYLYAEYGDLASEGDLQDKVASEKEEEVVKEIVFSSDAKLNSLYKLLDQDEFLEAEKVVDDILAGMNNLSEKSYLRAKAEKIYLVIMTRSFEEAKEYYDKEIPQKERRDLSEDASFTAIRAYILMSGILDKSHSECLYVLKKMVKAYKHVPEVRQELEKKLFNKAIEKIDEAHPNWEIGEYRILDK